jgi:hypothetical protein
MNNIKYGFTFDLYGIHVRTNESCIRVMGIEFLHLNYVLFLWFIGLFSVLLWLFFLVLISLSYNHAKLDFDFL